MVQVVKEVRKNKEQGIVHSQEKCSCHHSYVFMKHFIHTHTYIFIGICIDNKSGKEDTALYTNY